MRPSVRKQILNLKNMFCLRFYSLSRCSTAWPNKQRFFRPKNKLLFRLFGYEIPSSQSTQFILGSKYDCNCRIKSMVILRACVVILTEKNGQCYGPIQSGWSVGASAQNAIGKAQLNQMSIYDYINWSRAPHGNRFFAFVRCLSMHIMSLDGGFFLQSCSSYMRCHFVRLSLLVFFSFLIKYHFHF